MKRRILKCISTIEEFDIEEYNKLDIGVEIQDFTEPNLTEEEIKDIVKRYKELLKGFNGTKAMHGPFLDLKPASPDLEIRKISVNKYIRTLRIAKELEIDYVIFHSQINPDLKEPSMRALNNSQSSDSWNLILSEIDDYKGMILIENIFEKAPDMIRELIEKINLPNIKINLDLGHARLGKLSIETWIRELNSHIAYIHLHSNDGIYDQHKIPSDIEINALVTLLNKYNLDPAISLEYKTDNAEREIELLRKKL